MPVPLRACVRRCDASKAGDGQEDMETQGSAASGAASVSCKVLVRAVHSILRTLKKVCARGGGVQCVVAGLGGGGWGFG